MTDEADYTPWPTDPLPAKLGGDWLHFIDPDGQHGAIPLRGEPDTWTATDNGDGTVTVQPSIHLVGSWHSPNPATFRLVDELPLGKG